ncbi:MAG: replication initiator [Ferrimicrobium sp.]
MILSQYLTDQIVERAGNGYEGLMRVAKGARYCQRPVQLSLHEPMPGEIDRVFDDREPSRDDFDVIHFKACGTRRATLCAPCSRVYQGDARSLIRAGLLGGKGIPEQVQDHPAVFATLTAPSFGRVHQAKNRDGIAMQCHPENSGYCEHGKSMGCWKRHNSDEEIVGSALCDECYDYEGAVIWNAASSQLWQRTTIYLRRALAKLVGLSIEELAACVRLSYVKVVEFQRRGLIHLHLVIRLDDPEDISLAPSIRVDPAQIELALRVASRQVKVHVGPTDAGHTITWGNQIDTRIIDPNESGRVASYIAKYATKSACSSGALDHRFRTIEAIEESRAPKHLLAMARAAFELSENPDYAELNLARWAHDLGHRGHFLTKSRCFSVTFAYLHGLREAWRDRERLERAEALDPRFEETSELYFVGQGWPFACDAYLVAQQRKECDEARAYVKDQIEEELHQGGQR